MIFVNAGSTGVVGGTGATGVSTTGVGATGCSTVFVICGTWLFKPCTGGTRLVAGVNSGTGDAIGYGATGVYVKDFVCISDNIVILNPKPGFFDLGKNMLQIRITASGKELYTYKGEVMCYGNIVSDDAKEVEDNPTLMEQILSTVGEIKEEVGTKQPLGSYVTTDDFDQEKSILNKSINDKVELEKEERIAANKTRNCS